MLTVFGFSIIAIWVTLLFVICFCAVEHLLSKKLPSFTSVSCWLYVIIFLMNGFFEMYAQKEVLFQYNDDPVVMRTILMIVGVAAFILAVVLLILEKNTNERKNEPDQ